ncbi:MAG: phosphodiesterase [Mycobacterium sp.]
MGAEFRRRRAFHPNGVLARGSIERTAAFNKGLPIGTGDVVVRLSKGAGLPGEWPDFAGLAFRMDHGSSPWDVLMVTAGSNAVGRIVLRPTTSWRQATFSTLMPLGYGGQVWWLRAQILTPVEGGLSLTTLSEHLQNDPIHIALDQASGLGDFTPLGVLTVDGLLPESEQGPLALDPTVHSAPGVDLLPGWLTALRRGAYRGSRQGRHSDASVDSRPM